MAYFSDAEKVKLATVIKELQRQFGGGAWITADPALSAERRNRLATFAKSMGDKGFLKQAEKIAAQKYDDYGFKSEEDADKFFISQGFCIEKFPQSTDLRSFENHSLDPEIAHRLSEDIRGYGKVWILKIDP
jgi:hypothetical protein